MEIQVTRKQKMFLDADSFEVLFGGAAGGGKSYGQLIDALLYALRYDHSAQLILRRTFPELEHSIIFTSLQFYPDKIARYRATNHTWEFKNQSLIEFGYLAAEKEKCRRILALLEQKGEGIPRQEQLKAELAKIAAAEERMK